MNRPTRHIADSEIADELRQRLRCPPGRVAAERGRAVRRVRRQPRTIRRALDLLRDDGLVAARQGFGWFVAAEPVRQHLGQLGTIEAQLAGSGSPTSAASSSSPSTSRPGVVRQLLGVDSVLAPGGSTSPTASRSPCHRVVPGRARPAPVAIRRRAASVYELLDITLRGATQTIGADGASGREARLLRVPVGAPAAQVPA